MKVARIVLSALMLISAGCVAPDFLKQKPRFDNFYVSSSFPEFYVKDVAIVPFTTTAGISPEQLAMINETFVTELRKRNWYRVHVMSRKEAEEFTRLKRIDAVISGEVLAYQEIEPLKFGLQVAMRYLNTGQTAWSASNIFDASSKEVVQTLKQYYKANKDSTNSLWEHQAYLISIRKYVEFCSSVLIDTIKEGWEKEVTRMQKEAGGKK